MQKQTMKVIPEIETEIRDCFARISAVYGNTIPLAAQGSLIDKWGALSQYGHLMAEGFETQVEAESYTLNYYAQRMNLIRQ